MAFGKSQTWFPVVGAPRGYFATCSFIFHRDPQGMVLMVGSCCMIFGLKLQHDFWYCVAMVPVIEVTWPWNTNVRTKPQGTPTFKQLNHQGENSRNAWKTVPLIQRYIIIVPMKIAIDWKVALASYLCRDFSQSQAPTIGCHWYQFYPMRWYYIIDYIPIFTLWQTFS